MKNLNNKLVQRIIISLQILYILLYFATSSINNIYFTFWLSAIISILSLILSIEAECYEQLGQETQCDYFYQQNIKKEPHDPQLYLGYLLTLFDRYHHHISQFYQNIPFHHLDNSPSKYEIIDFMEEQ